MEVVGVDIAGRVDLEAVVVLVRILEQAVHRVQHLVRHREEPFARHSAIVQALLTLKTMVCGKEQLVRHHEEPLAGHSTIVQALLALKTLVCVTEHIGFSTLCDTVKNHSRATPPYSRPSSP